jgi:hypothetical protein
MQGRYFGLYVYSESDPMVVITGVVLFLISGMFQKETLQAYE